MYLNDPLFDIVNAIGQPISGAKAYFYTTGTDDLVNTYTTSALSTPNANPVIADSAGRFPAIFLDPTIGYRVKVYNADDELIADRDPIAQSNYFARTAAANTFTALNTFSNATGIKLTNIGTTASAANAFMDSSNGNAFLRSTSSRRYKTDIEPLSERLAEQVLSLEPVWYRSTSPHDKAGWSWIGLIAEDVAAIEPRLVHWRVDDHGEMVPDAVQYDRLPVLMLAVMKAMRREMDDLRARLLQKTVLASIPNELAGLAQPDEAAADLRDRLLKALADLRSMAVGNIPMTDEQRALLTTLEGAVAQRWFTD